MNTKQLDRAVKTLALAMSAELVGSVHESIAAGERAGALAHAAGLSLDGLVARCMGHGVRLLAPAAADTYSAVVDGWYSAADGH